MTNHRSMRTGPLCAGVLAALLASTAHLSAPAAAAEASTGILKPGPGVTRTLQMGVGKSVIVDLPSDASEIFVADPKIANAIVRSARRVYIDGIANGQTSIFALDKNGGQIAVFEISVGRDIAELTELLNAALPGNDIQVKTVSDSIILMGSVASAAEAAKALDIAGGFVGVTAVGAVTAQASGGPGGAAEASSAGGTPISGKLINSMIIRGLDQVSVRVTITEIRREILKQLGVSMAGTGSAPNAFTIQNPLAINGALTDTKAVLGWTNASGSGFSATLQAFEREGVARTLAEPTVTAVSGETAKFLAGGSVPVPQGSSCSGGVCSLTFGYEPYGVTLNFTPIVLSQGRIQLRVATEVTDLDSSKSISIGGTSVPAFRTRRNETTVELPSGGSIASAGLISTETEAAINGVPGLMNLPILGALFRSRDYQRNETELLIIVTPYIVHSVDPRQVVRPDANFTDATDPQSWILGRVNRLYSTTGTSDPIPSYSGRAGFIND